MSNQEKQRRRLFAHLGWQNPANCGGPGLPTDPIRHFGRRFCQNPEARLLPARANRVPEASEARACWAFPAMAFPRVLREAARRVVQAEVE
jgi:hypothetical protein